VIDNTGGMRARFHLALTFVAVMATACERPPDPTVAQNTGSRKAAPQPARKPAENYQWKSLDGQVVAVPLECGGKGYSATYVESTMRHPEYVVVTFTGPAPSVDNAERALRTCIQWVVDRKRVKMEVQGTVWHTRTGKQADAKTVVMPDGSSLLVYVPAWNRIATWKERWPPQ